MCSKNEGGKIVPKATLRIVLISINFKIIFCKKYVPQSNNLKSCGLVDLGFNLRVEEQFAGGGTICGWRNNLRVGRVAKHASNNVNSCGSKFVGKKNLYHKFITQYFPDSRKFDRIWFWRGTKNLITTPFLDGQKRGKENTESPRAKMQREYVHETIESVLNIANEIMSTFSPEFNEDQEEIMHQMQNAFAVQNMNTILTAPGWTPQPPPDQDNINGNTGNVHSTAAHEREHQVPIVALPTPAVMMEANKQAWHDFSTLQDMSKTFLEERRRTRQNYELFSAHASIANASPRLIAEYIHRRIALYVTLNALKLKRVRILKRNNMTLTLNFNNSGSVTKFSKPYDIICMAEAETLQSTNTFSHIYSETVSRLSEVELFYECNEFLLQGIEMDFRYALDGSKLFFCKISPMNFAALHPPLACPFCRAYVNLDPVSLRTQHLLKLDQSGHEQPTSTNAEQVMCSICLEECKHPVTWPCERCSDRHVFCYDCVWSMITGKKHQFPILLDA